jgi:hypothetical protein
MPSTVDGLPITGVGSGDPQLIRRRVEEARSIADLDERAARLYFLGRGLIDCDDPETGPDAAAVLFEAMKLGSSHAALDLGQLLLVQANTTAEVSSALGFIARAATDGLLEAQVLFRKVWGDAHSLLTLK